MKWLTDWWFRYVRLFSSEEKKRISFIADYYNCGTIRWTNTDVWWSWKKCYFIRARNARLFLSHLLRHCGSKFYSISAKSVGSVFFFAFTHSRHSNLSILLIPFKMFIIRHCVCVDNVNLFIFNEYTCAHTIMQLKCRAFIINRLRRSTVFFQFFSSFFVLCTMQTGYAHNL